MDSVSVLCLNDFLFLSSVILFSSLSVFSSQLFISEGVGVLGLLKHSPSDAQCVSTAAPVRSG
jgi:hypothetical protein